MMAGGDGDGEGAARRRRQRRLRSWLKHERQSVAMALAEFSHHASRGQTRARAREGVEHAKYVGLSAQKPPLPGQRPAPLVEVAEPQWGAVTDGYVAALGPLLEVASLSGGDGVDDTAVSFLLRENLKRAVKEEKEKERRRKLEEKAAMEKEEEELLAVASSARSLAQWARLQELIGASYKARRKRKRRRRRGHLVPRLSPLVSALVDRASNVAAMLVAFQAACLRWL